MSHELKFKILNWTVIIAGLGYFVDMYDLFLFNVTRVASLTDLGLTGDDITNVGITILNFQVIGLTLGAFLWGILSDKLGRKSCLLGSILLYSLASLGCAFVQTPDQYAWLRFIAGVGLAGEVGIGIALITEYMNPSQRGKSVALFAAMGFLGIVAAALLSEIIPWRQTYLIGAIAGFLLLFARYFLDESILFKNKTSSETERGNLFILFKNKHLLKKYICTILIALPVSFSVLFVTFSPEIGKALGITDPIKVSFIMIVFQLCLIGGDFFSAFLSDKLKSRKKVISLMKLFTLVILIGFFFMPIEHAISYYVFIGLFGLSIGYWVLINTIAAEQFGTNLRATTAATIPNFVRAAVIPFTLLYKEFKHIDTITVIIGMGILAVLISAIALRGVEETYGKDLDYTDKPI